MEPSARDSLIKHRFAQCGFSSHHCCLGGDTNFSTNTGDIDETVNKSAARRNFVVAHPSVSAISDFHAAVSAAGLGGDSSGTSLQRWNKYTGHRTSVQASTFATSSLLAGDHTNVTGSMARRNFSNQHLVKF